MSKAPKKPKKDSYEVGYKRPPAQHQFQPGQSGNPRGRRKGEKNTWTLLSAELRSLIAVNEGGTSKRISKREALIKGLVNRSLRGDSRPTNELLGLLRQLDGPPPSEGQGTPALIIPPNPAALLRTLIARIRSSAQEDAAPPESTDDN